MLSRISIGWQWLEKTLNDIIDEINGNRPLQSASIATEESPNGTVLRVIQQSTPQGQGSSASSSGGGAGSTLPDGTLAGWYQMAVKVRDDAGNCTDGWFYYWGSPVHAGLPTALKRRITVKAATK